MAVTVCRALAIDGWFWALVDWLLIFCCLSGRLLTSTAVHKDTFLYFLSNHNLATLIIINYHTNTCAVKSCLVCWVKNPRKICKCFNLLINFRSFPCRYEESKVQIFWECHKFWKNLLTTYFKTMWIFFFKFMWPSRNIDKEIIQTYLCAVVAGPAELSTSPLHGK
jgi:hypothetical protein